MTHIPASQLTEVNVSLFIVFCNKNRFLRFLTLSAENYVRIFLNNHETLLIMLKIL